MLCGMSQHAVKEFGLEFRFPASPQYLEVTETCLKSDHPFVAFNIHIATGTNTRISISGRICAGVGNVLSIATYYCRC